MIVYTAPFDPITDDELQQLKIYHKQTRKPIALAIVGDGIQVLVSVRNYVCVHVIHIDIYMS